MPGTGLAARLFALFGLDASSPPVAAVTRLADGGAPDKGWWLRADPVHLQIAGDRLILTAPGILRVSRAEAAALVDAIQLAFASDGWCLEARHPSRWYLRLPRPAAIRTTPLAEVVGHDIQPFLPQGDDGGAWRRHLNEVQMILAGTAINAEREARGEPTINSVWFWGEGALPVPPAARFVQVWSDELVGSGLASLTATRRSDLPADAHAWLAQASIPGEHLLVLTNPLADAGDPGLVGQLERDWFRPLVDALHRNDLAHLRIFGERGPGYAFDAQAPGPRWRRLCKLVQRAWPGLP